MQYFATFGGSTAACAAGLAVLDVIDSENLQVHIFIEVQLLQHTIAVYSACTLQQVCAVLCVQCVLLCLCLYSLERCATSVA
jgi:adenosylmethionine-8-amino-7-oxononanoate aminotransferase